MAEAGEFERLFRDVYLRFHRRDGRHQELSGASRAVLLHLSMSGPVTIGEAAKHLDRAQSVVSDIVTQLEGNGLLERRDDPADRRRTLVWLAPAGIDLLRRDGEVLDADLLGAAFRRMDPDTAASLIRALNALTDAADARPQQKDGS